MFKKTIAILGSTGSIGDSTLKIARQLGKEKIRVAALAARSNIDLLEQQAKEFNPNVIAVYEADKALALQKRLPHTPIVSGLDGLKVVAAYQEADFVVSAMSGTLGLMPTLAAIEAGKDVGLANKEALVSGGALVMDLVKKKKVNLIPIDSEHSAIFQCLIGEKQSSVHRLVLTASGGPFRLYSKQQLDQITPECALQHPTWRMGPKITIDCSTLMNKGLEAIEAHWLFNIPMEKIEVVIHPQSIIHSMVEFVDNAILAQMSVPNMMVPIQYALTYPDRFASTLPPYDFVKHSQLQFLIPDVETFRCLKLALDAPKVGGSLACYMNAANEVLVQKFLDKQISWREISTKLEDLMQRHAVQKITSLDDVVHIDNLAREEAGKA